MARVVRLLSKHWWNGTCLSSSKAWCGQWPHGGEGCWVGLEPDTQGSWALERASKRRRDSFASTLTAVPSPSSHNHPQALIRMWRTLHRTRSGGPCLLCAGLSERKNGWRTGFSRPLHYAVFSTRVTALDIHWMARLWITVTKSVQRRKPHRVHLFWMLLPPFLPLPLLGLQKSEIKGTLSTPSARRANLLPNRHHKWPLSLGNSIWGGVYFEWVVLSLVYAATFMPPVR